MMTAEQVIQQNHSADQKPSASTIDTQKADIFAKMQAIEESRGLTSDRPQNAAPKAQEQAGISEEQMNTKQPEKALEVDNLLDAVEIENNKTTNPNDWEWGEGLKGDGKKPDWIRKEFKSVQEQAKAYNALVKKFGDFHGAPENYNFSSVENSEFHVHAEAQNSKEFTKIAKDMGLSQDGFNKILGFFNKQVAPTFKGKGAAPIDSAAEIAKLGEGGREKVQILNTWLMNEHPESYGTFKKMMRTADDIKAFFQLRNATTTKDQESSNSIMHRSTPFNRESAHQNAKAELAAALKSNDPLDKERAMAKYKTIFSN